MSDLVLDTGPLAYLLREYFASENRRIPSFRPDNELSQGVVKQISRIVQGYDFGHNRYVIAASALAFVELAYKWTALAKGHIRPSQLTAFLKEPPEWFVVEPMDEHIMPYFMGVGSSVQLQDGRMEPIEWTDAIHMATALSREDGKLVTTDHKLLALYPERTLR